MDGKCCAMFAPYGGLLCFFGSLWFIFVVPLLVLRGPSFLCLCSFSVVTHYSNVWRVSGLLPLTSLFVSVICFELVSALFVVICLLTLGLVMVRLCNSQVPAWLPHRMTRCPRSQVSSSFRFQFHSLFLKVPTFSLLGEQAERVYGSSTGGNPLFWVSTLALHHEISPSLGKVLVPLALAIHCCFFLLSWLKLTATLLCGGVQALVSKHCSTISSWGLFTGLGKPK